MLNKVMLLLISVVLFTTAGMASSAAAPLGGSESASVTVVIPLSEDEEADLLFMREEEKLARDIYTTMANKWLLVVFSKIALSEQRHMDAIKSLLNQYNLTDPVGDESIPGGFVDQSLSDLYDAFLSRIDISVEAALLVAAEMEEIEIIDLALAISRSNPEHTDIIGTYESIMCASRNHLRAFVRHIELRGEPYDPVYLDDAEFDAIINSPMERSCGHNKGCGHRKGPHDNRLQLN